MKDQDPFLHMGNPVELFSTNLTLQGVIVYDAMAAIYSLYKRHSVDVAGSAVRLAPNMKHVTRIKKASGKLIRHTATGYEDIFVAMCVRSSLKGYSYRLADILRLVKLYHFYTENMQSLLCDVLLFEVDTNMVGLLSHRYTSIADTLGRTDAAILAVCLKEFVARGWRLPTMDGQGYQWRMRNAR